MVTKDTLNNIFAYLAEAEENTRRRQQEKFAAAFKAAHTKLLAKLEDPDSLKQINQQFKIITELQNNTTSLGLPEDHFEISQADIAKIKSVTFTPHVTEEYEYEDESVSVDSCVIRLADLLYSDEPDLPVYAAPKLVKDLSHEELEKVALHEMTHALHFTRDYKYRINLDVNDPKAVSYKHIMELNADGLSDVVKTSPSMAEVNKKLIWLERESFPQEIKDAYQLGLKNKNDAEKKTFDKITRVIASCRENSTSHPSLAARIENSDRIANDLSSKRYNNYLSDLYGVTVQAEASFEKVNQAKANISFSDIKEKSASLEAEALPPAGYGTTVFNKGMQFLKNTGDAIIKGVVKTNDFLNREARKFHSSSPIQQQFKENAVLGLGGGLVSAGLVVGTVLTGGALPLAAFLTSSTVMLFGAYRQNNLENSLRKPPIPKLLDLK